MGLRLLAFLFTNTLLEESNIDVGTSIGGLPAHVEVVGIVVALAYDHEG